MDTNAEWIEDQDTSPCLRVRIMLLKICKNHCLVHAASEMMLDICYLF